MAADCGCLKLWAGHHRRCRGARLGMSALPLKADIVGFGRRRPLRAISRLVLEIQGWLHALSTEVVSLINFDDDILEKVNGLFAVAVVNFDRHTHAVDVALNDFAVRLVTKTN